MQYDLKLKDQQDIQAEVEAKKKQRESKIRERKLLTSDVVSAEERERANKDKLLTKQNELRKVENKREAYMDEIQKLHKDNTKLEAEKEKYGLEATQANAKYYQALEQVKLKNNLITKLQKKNIDAEERLKMQQ